MNLHFIPLAGAIFALSMAAPAFAHHGWGGYQDSASDVTGTVVEIVKLSGAHASMKLRDLDGTIWVAVMPPPHSAVSVGIKEATIPLGVTVKAHGHRHRDTNKFEIKTEQLTMGERTFTLYPGRQLILGR